MNTKTPPVNSPNPQEITLSNSVRCRIADGWGDAGRLGQYFGKIDIDCDGMEWAIVRWDDEEDPDLHKARAIEIQAFSWRKL